MKLNVLALLCVLIGCCGEKEIQPDSSPVKGVGGYEYSVVKPTDKTKAAFAKGAGAPTPEDWARSLSERVDSILHSSAVEPLWIKAGRMRVFVGTWCTTDALYDYGQVELCPLIRDNDEELTERICVWLGYQYNQMERRRLESPTHKLRLRR